MAVWQFDFHLVPEAGILRRYGRIPLTVPNGSIDHESMWLDLPLPGIASSSFDRILPRAISWTPDIEQWGHAESDRVDVTREKDRIVDILARIDVRTNAVRFVQAIVKVAEENSLLILMENGYLIRPSVNGVLHAIRKSPAFKFVEDPEMFLRQLAQPQTD